MTSNLLPEIEAFLRDTGMGAYRFGMCAARNGRLVERLRVGRTNGRPARVWPETETEIREFMAAERLRRSSAPTT